MLSDVRIDIISNNTSLHAQIEEIFRGIEEVKSVMIKENIERYTGHELIEYMSLTITSGLVGGASYDIIKFSTNNLIKLIKKFVNDKNNECAVVVNGIKYRINDTTNEDDLSKQILSDIEE